MLQGKWRAYNQSHPIQKPVEIMATLIRKHSNPGDLVVDSFAGSAMTGVAALSEGRRFAGCEPDAEFFPKALARLRELGPVDQAAPSVPDDLPARYRAYIEELAATLSEDEIVERAAEVVHRMIDRLIVRHEPAAGGHTIEIFGNLVELIGAADSKNAAAYEAAACSLKLVAGTRNYRYRHSLCAAL